MSSGYQGLRSVAETGLYGGNGAEIDEDVRVEYWVKIRGMP
jgi:hypothetical protein